MLRSKVWIIAWSHHSPRAVGWGDALGASVSLQYEKNLKGGWRTPWRYLVQGWQTWRLLERERPQVVIARTPPIILPLLVALWCKLRSRRTSFVLDCDTGAFHSPKWRWALPLQRWLTGQALLTTVIDQAALETVQGWGEPTLLLQDKIPNLVAPGSSIGSAGQRRVAVISSFDVDEPIVEIFEAAQRLPEVTFYHTGDPQRAPATLIETRPKNVVLTGYLRGGDYTGLLANVEGLVVLTNESHALNCGAYEALSIGKPAVVSDWPEMRQYFSDGFTHVANTPEAIADGIATMLANLDQLSGEVAALRERRAAEWQSKIETFARLLDGEPVALAGEKQPLPRPAACLLTYSDFGANGRARKQAEALLESGFSVDCIVPRSSDPRTWDIPPGVKLHFLPVAKQRSRQRLGYALRYLGFFGLAGLTLTRLHFKRRYSYIQVSTLPEFLCFAAVVPRLMGVRVVLDVCDLSSELYESKFQRPARHFTSRLVRQVEKLSLNFASALLTVHEPYRRKLLERGIPASKITVLLNVADESVFQFQLKEVAAPAPARLVYHGTLARRNGVDIIVQAIAEIKKRQPRLNLTLDVYGDGDYYGEVAALVNRLEVAESVRLHRGFIGVNQLPELLAGATAGVVANRCDGFMEYTLPTKLLEYVALGVPSIVPRTPSIETYFDGQMVAFFEPENPAELAQRILELLEQPGRGAEMARQSYRFYEKHNWSITKKRYLELVRNLSRQSATNKRVNQGHDN